MNGKYVSRKTTEEERDLVDGIRYLLGKEPLYETDRPSKHAGCLPEHSTPRESNL